MGRLDDIIERNQKNMKVMDALGTASSVVTGVPTTSEPQDVRVPSARQGQIVAYICVALFVFGVIAAFVF